jgi:RimJ/RimL family protein N-acetyltransferase
MTSAVQSKPIVYHQKGVRFEENGESLRVEIETRQLKLRSVQASDLLAYQALYTHPQTMQKFTDNEERFQKMGADAWKAQQMESIAKRVALWVKRWNVEHDPFSAFVILKKDSGEMVGHIVAEQGDNPGESEVAFVIHEKHWHKKYGAEAVEAIVLQYLDALKENETLVDGVPLSKICAKARLDNFPAIRILEKLGFKKVGEEEKRGFYCKA